MAMSGNMGSLMSGAAKRPQRPARAPRTPAPLMGGPSVPVAPPQIVASKTLAPYKPLAGMPSTKPSDRPVAQQQLRAAKKAAPAVMKTSRLPKVLPKPATSKPTTSRARRPKTGMK